jgi:hypothetical protein
MCIADAAVGIAGRLRSVPRTKATARKLRADGHSIREIGQLLGNGKPVSRQTVYQALGMIATGAAESRRQIDLFSVAKISLPAG